MRTVRTLEQSLSSAIGELRCIDLDSPTSRQDLQAVAVAIARECVKDLLAAFIDELRSSSGAVPTWTEIAASLNEDCGPAVRMRHGTPLQPDDEHVAAFWADHADQFAWDFLLASFLHALYGCWVGDEHPGTRPMRPKALTRRLTAVLAQSGGWRHSRMRTGSLGNVAEPPLDGIAWRPYEGGQAVWGFRHLTASE